MSIDRLPPLDLHTHVGDGGAMPLIEDARVFGQTITPEEWDDQSVRWIRPDTGLDRRSLACG